MTTNTQDPAVLMEVVSTQAKNLEKAGWQVVGEISHVVITGRVDHGGWIKQVEPGSKKLTLTVFHPRACRCDLDDLPGNYLRDSYPTDEGFMTAHELPS